MTDFFDNGAWFWKFHQDFFKDSSNNSWITTTSHVLMIDSEPCVIFGKRRSVVESKDEPPKRAFQHAYQGMGYVVFHVIDKFEFKFYYGTSSKSLGFVDNRFVYNNLTLLGSTSKDEVEHIFMLLRLSI